MAKRLFFRIKEVAQLLGEEPSTIRYWETVFPHLVPSTTPNGVRQYTERDIQNIEAIRYLLRVKKLTIEGAKSELATRRSQVELRVDTITRLKHIHSQLTDLRESKKKRKKKETNTRGRAKCEEGGLRGPTLFVTYLGLDLLDGGGLNSLVLLILELRQRSVILGQELPRES